MRDSLGLFGSDDRDGRRPGGADSTGEYDLAALRDALQTPRGDQATIPKELTRQRLAGHVADEDRRRRRRRSTLIAGLVLLLIAAAIFVLVRTWSAQQADFSGRGTTETVIRVNANDGIREIGTALYDARVVASVEAFVLDAAGNDGISTIQPGYYKVRQGASASAAIAALLDEANRVGRTELIPGVALADTRIPSSGETIAGYVTQVTQAACVPLNGVADCFTAAEMWQEIRTADVASMGLIGWAVPRVTANPDLDHRLEGMIAPGVYNIPPTTDPAVVLKYLLGASAVYWNTRGVTQAAEVAGGLDPYDVVIIASLIEREAITSDMRNVSRVIENRLAIPMILQLDSTVNYANGESQIATTAESRLDPTSPYNTYAHQGLPPTPIGAVGPDALDAALHPAEGNWLYFVKVNPATGQSCFSVTLEEHNKCVEQARAAGVFG
jgi:UPF0755 protein